MADAAPDSKSTPLDVNYTPMDNAFGKPFIDADEMRMQPRPHRYVHGGFADTKTKFSFYFPPDENYDGRFMQWIEGGAAGNELSIQVPQDKPSEDPAGWDFLYDIAFDDLKGYLLESNQGHEQFSRDTGKNHIANWQASAESARFSRHIARQVYGVAPHHGYVGGIGGGPNTQMLLENAPDIYDGGVPQISPSNETSPWSAQVRAQYFLGSPLMKSVIDAVEPGGSGDPYSGLDANQREALSDMYRAGWPRGAENQLMTMKHAIMVMGGVEMSDPSYFDDFWTKPGYAGNDQLDKLKPYIIQRKAIVQQVLPIREAMETATFKWYTTLDPDTPYAVILDVEDHDQLFGSHMRITTGAAKGREFVIASNFNGISGTPERTPEMMRGVKPGDEVELDNRKFIAYMHHFLHTIKASDWYREKTGQAITLPGRPFTTDGRPIYAQRERSSQTYRLKGEFEPKMICINSTWDIWGWPVMIDYLDVYKASYGDKLSDRFRFYWADGGSIAPPMTAAGFKHSDENLQVWDARMIDFQYSMGRQAWRYLKEWVEDNKPPPPSTEFSFSKDNELLLPQKAEDRKGIQPVVHATVNNGKRIDVKVGEVVRFEGRIEAPPGAGTIVSSEWDLEERGDYPFSNAEADGSATSMLVKAKHVYSKPGVYFVALRGGLHRDGKRGTGAPTHHLDRVRVVVT
ncbi:MAG: hypothetical protein VR73_04300 [Gammaproteobacteria bacterium BRH_c0]|nr:MAG: hypothetical protein VR73_04300 [Gammaproteobacteria bacterium BRH_c0]